MPKTHILEVTVSDGEAEHMEDTLEKYIEVSIGVKHRGIKSNGNTLKIFLNSGGYNKKEIAKRISHLDYVKNAHFTV